MMAGPSGLLGLVAAPLWLTLDGVRFHLFRDIPTLLSAFTDSVIWFETPPGQTAWKIGLGLAASFVLLTLVTAAFVPLGQRLGRLLDDSPDRIAAYSLNVGASLAGIWALNALAFAYQPPWVWFGIVLVLLLVMIARDHAWSVRTVTPAAAWMRRLAGDRQLARRIGESGRSSIREQLSPRAIGRLIESGLRLSTSERRA